MELGFSSHGGYVNSAVVNGEYFFAVPSGAYNLTIEAPPGVASALYNVTIDDNGVFRLLSGVVYSGSPVIYSVTPSKSKQSDDILLFLGRRQRLRSSQQ